MTSPSTSDDPAPPSSRKPSRPLIRGKLRNGTFILPGTGERLRRQITLGNPINSRGSYASEDTLLPLRRQNSQAGTFRRAIQNTTVASKEFWKLLKSPIGRAILKCSLAYLLGSLATFLPPLSNFLGQQNDGKHMVATITVYFHPGRSAGSMLEADMLGVAAFLYAAFISIASMAVSVVCESQWGLIELGYILVLVVFCGGGLGFVGWTKQKFNTPLVNVACSLTSLAIITVLTKENAVQTAVFSNNKIVQVLKMVVMGIISTTAVSLLVFPVSARTELRETMIKTTDSFGDMLTTITRGFLDGSETDLRSSSFNKTLSRYKSGFPQLAKHLEEAKLEHYVLGTENEYKLEASLVNCMQRLAQSIGGLRSAATTQFTLLKGTTRNDDCTTSNSVRLYFSEGSAGLNPSNLKSRVDRFEVLSAIDETLEEGSGGEDQHAEPQLQGPDMESSIPMGIHTARTPSEIFARFIDHLGPSMKSLAYTLSQILRELPFGPGPDYQITLNEHFKTSLTDALELYTSARAEALQQLYKTKELDKARPESIEVDFEEVAASCGHFSFSLQDFATEMQTYLEILEDLKEEVERPERRSWKWARFWEKSKARKACADATEPEGERLLEQTTENNVPHDIPELVIARRDTTKWTAAQEDHSKQGIYRRLLKLVRFFQRDDIRFAVKVGIGAALFASLAFIPSTRPYYQHWRGEWGLLSFMLVCSMTVGASNTTGWARFTGTTIGAILSVFVWVICQGNPFALIFCSWIVSLVCFYFIVAAKKGPFGRFTILTYNLSVLYAYTLSVRQGEDDGDEGGVNPFITEISLHRLVAVFTGTIWGLVMTRVIWPISARRRFKDGLSILWLRMSLIWKRDPLSMLLEGESLNSYMNLREEFALQRYVSLLDALRGAALSEFELRGPFPVKEYGRIMEATNKMLDAFHAMNVVIQKDVNASDGEADLLKYTADERAELCARISHIFSVLASSLKLEYPLNYGLPSTTNARDRLLAKIFQYRKNVASAEEGGIPVAKDEDYALLYAYALVTGQVAEELKKIEKEIEDLFGVMDEELIRLQ